MTLSDVRRLSHGEYASLFVESLLFGVTGADPVTYTVAAGVLIAVTLLASLRPVHRAARVDPMIALRAD